MDNYQDIADALGDVCEVAAAVFQELAEAFLALSYTASETWQNAWNQIREILDSCDDLYDKPTNPREYGISLLHLGRDRYRYRAYNYIPSAKKNMPYMRRCFN